MENVRAIKSKEAYVQLHFPHGEEEVKYVKEELGRKVISVVFANEEISPLNAGLEKVKLGADMVLLEYGRSAWDSVIEKVSDMKNLPIGVAGRVTASNLRKLLKYSPYFVDVSSSLEVIPGRKNHKKIHEFMEVIRSEGATVQQS
jgi:phosphoribosylanthranilate isomerase